MADQRLKKKDLRHSRRQIGMVLDLNKCLGCHTCSVACKTQWSSGAGQDYMYYNSVETLPGEGYPRGYREMGGGYVDGWPQESPLPSLDDHGVPWEFNHEAVLFGGEGATDRLRPVGDHPEWGPNWDEDIGAGEFPNSYYFYLPRLCNHCTNPACLEACPRNAIYKRDEDGIVLIDEHRCRGYRFCQSACPYKKIYFNFVTQTAQKCIFCYPRLEQGVANACARQCPGRLRFVGYLNDKTGPIYQLVSKWKVALPYLPQRGTGPNVFYVPPLGPPTYNPDGTLSDTPRIPPEYLESLFGKHVHRALDTLKTEMARQKRGERSELIDILIAWNFEDSFQLAGAARFEA